CKLALIVWRDAGVLRRYVDLVTGNYGPGTAKLYTDISLFTVRDEYAQDASAVFNLLTGYSRPASWRKILVAPLNLKSRVIEMIDREAEIARQTGKGRIVAKMNSLSESDVIRALYRASQAGVQIDLI